MHFVEPTHIQFHPSPLIINATTLSVRPPTAGPKKQLYPFSGALYLCPLKYHLGRDSPTNSKKPSVLALKTLKNDPPGGVKIPQKVGANFWSTFRGYIKEVIFRKTQNPEYT